MKNSFVFRMAIVLFCIGFLLTGTIANAGNTVSDLKDQQSDIESKKEEIQAELDAQKSALEDNQSKLAAVVKEKASAMSERDDLELQIETIFNTIQQIEATIIDTENEYNRKVALLKERSRVMYQLSDYTKLQMFIESDDLLEFLNRQSYYNVMLEKDQALIQEVQNLKADLEIKKKIQTDNQISYEALLEEKEEIIAKLERDEDYLSSLSASTKSMIDKLEEQEEEMDKESERLESKIKELQAQEEARKKAEEEAARKAAQEQANNASSGGSGETYTGGKFLWPSEASHYISSYFGMRYHPIYHYMRMHNGIDIAAAGGTNILAAESGTVIEATYNSGYGNYIVIYHGNGISTLYAHSSRLIASVGDHVSRGQVIALVGTTGNSTGNHLHFEVRIDGVPHNPLDYL